MQRVILPFPKVERVPTRDELVEKVRRLLATNSETMRMDNPHVQERLQTRRISMRQVLDALENATTFTGPKLDKYGDWRIKLIKKSAGRRVQVVVAVPLQGEYFTLVTVI